MKKYPVLATAIVALMLVAGCGGNDKPSGDDTSAGGVVTKEVPKVPNDKTIEINGKSFTCGQTIGADKGTCDDNYQRAFNLWGDNIVAYMDSGVLGPLGNNMKSSSNPDAPLRYEDIAASGLGACIFAANGTGVEDMDAQTKFVDWLSKIYPDEDRVAFLPMWFGANRYLCDDATTVDGGFQSHDLEAP